MQMFRKVLITIILIVAVLFVLVEGFVLPVISKFNSVPMSDVEYLEKGQYVEDTVYCSSDEYYTITHLIGGLIPTGVEHYYLIYNKDFTECVVLRAGSGWADKFDEDGYNFDGVRVGGVLKKMDYEMRSEINKDIQNSGYDIDIPINYIDGLSDRYAVFTIICAVVFAGILSLLFMSKKEIFKNALVKKIVLFILFLNTLFALNIISMVM